MNRFVRMVSTPYIHKMKDLTIPTELPQGFHFINKSHQGHFLKHMLGIPAAL